MEDNIIQEYYKQCSNIFQTGSEFDLLNQVGKTYLGKTIDMEIFNIIILSIVDKLKINKHDNILDLGCANGLVSNHISKYAKFIDGFDLSDDLINIAKQYNKVENISFHTTNILNIDFKVFDAMKLYMYEVLQFFDMSKLKMLLQNISYNRDSFSFFIGSIPDAQKLFEFYNTKERKKYYFSEVLEKEIFHIGNWWYKEQIQYLCEELGLKCQIIEQDKRLHTAHYRFDCLIEKV